jgi:pimeloyl-ACP methyl ester carboxylesterase
MSQRFHRRAIRLVLVVSAAAFLSTAAIAAAAPTRQVVPSGLERMSCLPYRVPVAIVQGGPESYTMYGELCHRGLRMPRTVQLLVHGATYQHYYWEMPVQDGTADLYNYPLVATAAGYATFNVDRIGSGASSHPLSTDVSVEAGAIALHGVIVKLRAGWFAGHSFQRIIWVGHSFGSIAAWAELSMYHDDVDGVIITGALHKLTSLAASGGGQTIYPANQDPAFQDDTLDDGYLTTVPPSMNNNVSARQELFYYSPTADPDVIATDETHKDVVSGAQLNWLSNYALQAGEWPSQQMTMPVLTVVGQQDALFCGDVAVDCSSDASVQRFESRYYPPQAHLLARVIPSTGHDIQLQETVPLFYSVALGWALSNVRP